VPTEQLVTIVVPTYNRADSIGVCLRSLLDQDHANIEILVCDDGSTDRTTEVVSSIEDPRLSTLGSEVNQGVSAARNRGILAARGEIIFFTDDDVEVEPDWIVNGLRHFEDPELVGIEGKIVWVASNYSPHYGERTVSNTQGGQYMSANVAYRRSALIEAGLFHDTKFEDRDLALRLLGLGRIAFAEDAAVRHMKERYTVRTFFREAIKVGFHLDFQKDHGEGMKRLGPVLYPSHMVTLLFPPLILTRLPAYSRWDLHDALMLLLAYPRLVLERLVIWRWAVRTRTFSI
jgi:glycosyltransferase involved in cell wall biosynthesis